MIQAAAANAIYIEKVGKTFDEPIQDNSAYVLRDVDLLVNEGEFFILLGPSGCGKSTLLNLIAGFIKTSEGALRLGSQNIKQYSSQRAMVFQNAEAALFPWLTVRENVEFGLKMKKLSQQERKPITDHYLEIVGLLKDEQKFPHELSGGMKQRVQLARVLANNPKILLMDEPFGALDAMTRRSMQKEVVHIWQKTKKTIVFVTHDIQEALLLGQRIGIMSVGPDSKIVDIIKVPFSYPRDNTSVTFNKLYEKVEQHFEL